MTITEDLSDYDDLLDEFELDEDELALLDMSAFSEYNAEVFGVLSLTDEGYEGDLFDLSEQIDWDAWDGESSYE